jgi:hypothetical protein
MLLECLSKDRTCRSEWTEGLCVEIIARDDRCTIFHWISSRNSTTFTWFYKTVFSSRIQIMPKNWKHMEQSGTEWYQGNTGSMLQIEIWASNNVYTYICHRCQCVQNVNCKFYKPEVPTEMTMKTTVFLGCDAVQSERNSPAFRRKVGEFLLDYTASHSGRQ